ncbi:SCP-like protein [Oesophagostomum dentatum]|uniref:SCP-like protein n=1 Tax=Oesophagostomum dentatum TaxID=61180 RepID=A0A0B1T5M7_OESDE|nr:SCP-like protein [Oesophagostomum dentatum]
MNDTIRLRVLAKHNALRTDLALGVVLNGQTDTYLRKANKMFQLRYSCNLETTAIERAKQCSAISNRNPPNDVSENFRKYTQNLNRDRASAATMTTQLWWSEITRRQTSINQVLNIYYDHLGISSFAKVGSSLFL